MDMLQYSVWNLMHFIYNQQAAIALVIEFEQIFLNISKTKILPDGSGVMCNSYVRKSNSSSLASSGSPTNYPGF
jgi:hypothetical protein